LGLDIEILHRPDVVADNTAMPFRNEALDVVVYDPPHIPNQGKDNEKDFNVRFGLVLRSSKRTSTLSLIPTRRSSARRIGS
jgi:predicted methyltransferase